MIIMKEKQKLQPCICRKKNRISCTVPCDASLLETRHSGEVNLKYYGIRLANHGVTGQSVKGMTTWNWMLSRIHFSVTACWLDPSRFSPTHTCTKPSSQRNPDVSESNTSANRTDDQCYAAVTAWLVFSNLSGFKARQKNCSVNDSVESNALLRTVKIGILHRLGHLKTLDFPLKFKNLKN